MLANGLPYGRSQWRPESRRAPGEVLSDGTTRVLTAFCAERIAPAHFARGVGIARQSLLRFRSGRTEPCQSTLARMVGALRRMTGKPYRASHLYDVGEGLAELSPTEVIAGDALVRGEGFEPPTPSV